MCYFGVMKDTESMYRFPVLIEHDADGYTALCPDLQGCYTQGETYEEVRTKIEDAIRLHLEDRRANHEEIPQPQSAVFSTVEVSLTPA